MIGGPGTAIQPDGGVALVREDAALGRPLQVALLDEEGLVDLLQRLGLLADGDGDRAHADRAAAVVLGHDAQHPLVHLVEAGGVDLEELEAGRGHVAGDRRRPARSWAKSRTKLIRLLATRGVPRARLAISRRRPRRSRP
jgi:hypothetical protein